MNVANAKQGHKKPPVVDRGNRVDKRFKPYQPFGASLDVFYAKDQEVLACGPAGTGKSRAILEKINLCCLKYPGMRALLIRKTRESLTQSAMVTFEKFVIPENGMVRFRTAEQEYRYSNGSVIVVGGMDKSSKVLSSEYDLIYPQEATELSEEDWETLVTRCRFGVMPYNQVIGDCNPSHPRHWLKQRAERGALNYIASLHTDNPVYFDQKERVWTKRGLNYMEKLQSLTGVRRKRLYEGKWAAAEGMIYQDEWDPEFHLIDRKSIVIKKHWQRIWVVDFGFIHPFVWQCWVYDDEYDTAYRIAEIHSSRILVEDAATYIKKWLIEKGERLPDVTLCDWDAEGRATLEKHLEIQTEAADKSVLDGIESVKNRLKIVDDGVERRSGMYFVRDSLLFVDEESKDFGLPVKTEDEFDAYEWDDGKRKEAPKKIYDDGMDTTRYLARHLDANYGGWSQGMAK